MYLYRKFVISKNSFYYFTPITITILAVISTIVSLYNFETAPSGFGILFLLPLLYCILFNLTNVRKAMFIYPSITMLNVILATRYLIVPLYSSLTGVYFHSYPPETYGTANTGAILLMLYEMICIFIVLHLAISKLEKQRMNKPKEKLVTYDDKYIVYYIAIIIGVASFIIFPAIRDRLNFVIVNEFVFSNLNSVASLGFLLTTNVLVLLFLIVVFIQYKRIKSGKRLSSLTLLLFAFLNIAAFWSTNRLTVVAQGIATILLISSVIPTDKSKKYLNTLLGVILILAIFSLSSYRWFSEGDLSNFGNSINSKFDIQETGDYLQAYFGGQHLISTAILARSQFGSYIGFDSFLNEILTQILFVRQIPFFDATSTTTIFNSYFGYTDVSSMILPTIGQGYMYFGVLGAPLLSIIFTIFIYFVEKRLIRTTNIGEKYAYYILAIWLAFFPMQNLNIVTATIFNKFLPLYLIIILNRRITLYKDRSH